MLEVAIALEEAKTACPDWEAELVERARFDRKAFGELYHRHYAAVGAYVYRRVGNRHLAEDIVADVFMATLKAIRGYQPRGLPIRAWFYRIATHEVNRWWRKHRRWNWSVQSWTSARGSSTSPDPDVDPGFAAAVAALRRVSPKLQAVLALHYCEGLSVEEVAQVLNCRVGTVKSRLSRGRDALREALSSGS